MKERAHSENMDLLKRGIAKRIAKFQELHGQDLPSCSDTTEELGRALVAPGPPPSSTAVPTLSAQQQETDEADGKKPDAALIR